MNGEGRASKKQQPSTATPNGGGGSGRVAPVTTTTRRRSSSRSGNFPRRREKHFNVILWCTLALNLVDNKLIEHPSNSNSEREREGCVVVASIRRLIKSERSFRFLRINIS